MPKSPLATPTAAQPRPDSKAIAPVWHTAVVLLLLLTLVAIGLFVLGGDFINHAHHRAFIYAITMVIEWLIVAFIALGARWQGASLSTLTGGNSPQWRSIARDLGLALAFLIVANIVLGILGFILGHLTHATTNAAIKNFLPHTALEIALWLLLSLTAGICEEMIFRGYLQRQFCAWTGSATAGIALQGIVFGAAHAYQGPTQILVISVYGCMFGLLAHWRKSLRPGMAAHFFQDCIGGLMLSRFMPK
jgi:membrane protease YdiL (CAAX protease family)